MRKALLFTCIFVLSMPSLLFAQTAVELFGTPIAIEENPATGSEPDQRVLIHSATVADVLDDGDYEYVIVQPGYFYPNTQDYIGFVRVYNSATQNDYYELDIDNNLDYGYELEGMYFLEENISIGDLDGNGIDDIVVILNGSYLSLDDQVVVNNEEDPKSWTVC